MFKLLIIFHTVIEGDMSVDYNVCDALDVIGGNVGQKQSSWDRDLGDGDLDFYYVVNLNLIMQNVGIYDEFFSLDFSGNGVIIRYNVNTEDEIIILKKANNSEYKEIFRSIEKRGDYLDKDVFPSINYFYLLKSGNKTLGPLSIFIKEEGEVKIYGLNSFYSPKLKTFYIFDSAGRKRFKPGKGLILLNDFKCGIYFIKNNDKTLKIVNIK